MASPSLRTAGYLQLSPPQRCAFGAELGHPEWGDDWIEMAPVKSQGCCAKDRLSPFELGHCFLSLLWLSSLSVGSWGPPGGSMPPVDSA